MKKILLITIFAGLIYSQCDTYYADIDGDGDGAKSVWCSYTELPHATGGNWEDANYETNGCGTVGWNGDTPAGHLTYGPYLSSDPGTTHVIWNMLANGDVDNDGTQIATIDIYDSTSGELLAWQDINVNDFNGSMAWQDFTLSYYSSPDHAYEFRTWYTSQGGHLVLRYITHINEVADAQGAYGTTELCEGDDTTGWSLNDDDPMSLCAENSNDDCWDCASEWGGSAIEDECGVCDGDDISCADCAGVPNGDNLEDNCGTCDNDATNDCVQDCAGNWGGSTTVVVGCDECGGGGNSDQAEGLGIAGTYTIGECEVSNIASGEWSVLTDGVCFLKDDDWRIFNTGCGWNIEHYEINPWDEEACEMDPMFCDMIDPWERYVRTYTGQCSEIPEIQNTIDALTTTITYDSFGNLQQGFSLSVLGSVVEDNCGTCDNDPSNDCVQDCAGNWGGDSVVDDCGECGGDGSSCACTPNGDANGDMSISVTDLVLIIDSILDGTISDELICSSDVNSDGTVDVVDIVAIIESIIN